eukprot:jgi/Astpho2/3705/gw1.00060.28.1_t
MKRARKVPPNNRLKNEAQRARNLAARQLDTLTKELTGPLSRYVKGFQHPSRLHPFERALLELTLGEARYCIAVERVDTLRKAMLEAGKVQAARAGKLKTRKEAEAVAADGFERVESAYRARCGAVEELKGVAKRLRRLPVIQPEIPTVALVGAPNVGKSSLVQVLSSGLPEVCDYPFTTRTIKMGHFYVEGRRHQITDTPGLLNRPDEDRNAMERLTLASLQHLPTAVLFVVDLTEGCGTSVGDQRAIRRDLKRAFPYKLWLDIFSKADLLED